MLSVLLKKQDVHNLSLSVFTEFPPDLVLDYFQHDYVEISLPIYQELRRQFSDPENMNENVTKWILLIDKMLDMEGDLTELEQNRHILFVGPAYFIRTNTRFFFYKSPFEHEGITAEDISNLLELNATPVMDEQVGKYYAALKVKPSAKKSRDELLHDLNICITVIEASQLLSRQINFHQVQIESKEGFLNAPYTAISEPDQPMDKPQKPEPAASHIRHLFTKNRDKTPSYSQLCEKYNQDVKVYFINYREYEKACDRFKAAVKEWETEKNDFINRSIEEIKKARLKQKKGARILKIYNEIVRNLDVHPDYQNLDALTRFQFYLDTGRASNLQECMNLYENEQHWVDLKESQSRLERNILATICFLRSEAAAGTDIQAAASSENILESMLRKARESWPGEPPR